MKRRTLELYVGLFVVIGMAAAGYLVTVIGGFGLFSTGHQRFFGYFASTTGLKEGAAVEIAGVRVGQVEKITIEKERLVAHVVMRLDKTLELSEDSIASVKTSGIIGEKYINISPGGSDEILADGDEIENTESALDLESLVRKFIFGSNGS